MDMVFLGYAAAAAIVGHIVVWLAPDAGYYVEGVMQKKWGWLVCPALLLAMFNLISAFGFTL